jgi:hypothetical protein
MTHVTLQQTIAWIAAGAGAWMMVRAGAAKGVVKVKASVHCASCGRQKIHGRCPCTDR